MHFGYFGINVGSNGAKNCINVFSFLDLLRGGRQQNQVNRTLRLWSTLKNLKPFSQLLALLATCCCCGSIFEGSTNNKQGDR
jgi:hypothetical protein